ncbi:MAG: aquaporin [Bdellovibrionales bacterium]|nr:aquaporin [Bdellovibrionales bacterium]
MLNKLIDPPGEYQVWQRYFAEFIGTYALVFIGCGAVIANHYTQGAVSHTGISVAFGAVVAAMIFSLGPVSAAHFNPAVTFGFALAGRFGWRFVIPYWIMQSLGATAASYSHFLLLPYESNRAVHFGATSSLLNAGQIVGLETIFTTCLMLVIMAVATDKRVSGTIPALAIGLAVTMAALAGGPFTGASMNPARSLGPALFSGGIPLNQLSLYILGPFLGSSAAAFVFELLRDNAKEACSAPDILKGKPSVILTIFRKTKFP